MQRTRAEVIAKAREYLDTPFQHQARCKGLAIDCVGLALCVGEDLQMNDKRGEAFDRNDHPNYPAQPIGNQLAEEIACRAIEVDKRDMRPGDVVTLRCGRVEMHVGILTDLHGGVGLIHAYAGGPRRVSEHRLDDEWLSRVVRVFRYPEVID